MGDRCAVYITCRKRDKKRITEIMLGSFARNYRADTEHDVTKDVVELEFGEMNYAAQEQLEELARHKLLFYGWHGAGCSYSEGIFVSDGTRFIQCLTVTDETGPLVNVHSDGSVDQAQLKHARKYWRAIKKVKEGFGIEKEG